MPTIASGYGARGGRGLLFCGVARRRTVTACCMHARRIQRRERDVVELGTPDGGVIAARNLPLDAMPGQLSSSRRADPFQVVQIKYLVAAAFTDDVAYGRDRCLELLLAVP